MRTVSIFMLFALASASNASIIHVDDSAVTGGNNGSSWTDAFTNLQSALSAACAGDEIRVGQGNYVPGPERSASFHLKSGVIIQGGYAGVGARDPDALDPDTNQTYLSGLFGDPASIDHYCYHVIRAGNDVDATAELRGVIVTLGMAIVPYAPNWHPDDVGGGMKCEGDASPMLADCAFEHNYAYTAGGGIHKSGGGSPTLLRCRFEQNGVNGNDSGSGGAVSASGPMNLFACKFQFQTQAACGGAVSAGGSAMTLHSCAFINNSSGEEGGAICGNIAAAVDCDFISNGSYEGGAIWGGGTLTNCRFLNNAASTGGAIKQLSTPSTFVNCLFSGNSSGGPGGAAIFHSAAVVNCTFVGNYTSGGGAIWADDGASISNCIVWDNTTTGPQNQSAQISNPGPAVNNTCVMGWDGSLGGKNNSGANPQFIDADGPDDQYGTDDDNPRLSASSPYIDAGDNSFLPPDAFDLDNDGDLTEPIPFDLDSQPRIVNDVVDLGPYEVPRPDPCPADIAPPGPPQGDSQVNVADLLLVINSWGQCSVCPADINGDGIVNVVDLLTVINAWGSCP